MRNKKLFIQFAMLYGGPLLLALLLEIYTRTYGDILYGELTAKAGFIFSSVTALFSVLFAFLAIRQESWPSPVRIALLHAGALLIVLDYYLFSDTNVLACLLILAGASFFVLLKKRS